MPLKSNLGCTEVSSPPEWWAGSPAASQWHFLVPTSWATVMGGGSTRVQPNSLLSAGPSPGWDLLILTIRQRFSICTVRKDICAPGPHQTTVVWMCSSKCPERALYPSNLIHEIRKQPAIGLLLWHLSPYAITRTKFGGKRETRALKPRTQAVFWKRPGFWSP